MKENKKNQPVFGTAVNTDKKAGQQGAEVLRQFMLDKYKKDPATMTKAEKKGLQENGERTSRSETNRQRGVQQDL